MVQRTRAGVGTKLTPAQVLDIYNDTRPTIGAHLACKYGVSKVMIHNIRTGKSWSTVTDCARAVREQQAGEK